MTHHRPSDSSPDRHEARPGSVRRADPDLGLGLAPGDRHYRAYVGPPRDYDLLAALTFSLLTVLGLRQHHSLVDIGCGSLRVGRLLIPYLNPRKYLGVEPEKWLVEEGIGREVGRDQVDIKEPRFLYSSDPGCLPETDCFDFALAQSIFSHAGLDLIDGWLESIAGRLAPEGALVATFVAGDTDHEGPGWRYPECVAYTRGTMAARAAKVGLGFRVLDWPHPRQTWALFSAPEADFSWLEDGPILWVASLGAGVWDPVG